jgi:phage baseplate assembly protein W
MDYVIRMGDTLQIIAQKVLGDATLWTDIAQTNNLSYPYISSVRSTGVVSVGDVISVSTTDTISGDVQVPDLGTDLRLGTDKFNLTSVAGGDLSTVDGDYELVSGATCVVQDTAHRLMTDVGSNPYYPDYGSRIPQMIGSKRDSTWQTKITLEVERTLRCDPRVTDVHDISLYQEGTGTFVDYTATIDDMIFNAREVLFSEEI